MGKVVKSVVSGTVDAVKNAPKTIGKSAVDLGKSAVGANGGNYFKSLGESAINSAVVSSTGGMTGTKDLGGTNNLDTQVANLMGKGGDLTAPEAVAAPDPNDPANMDPNLKAELENSKKKGRASTILAGGSDSIGSTSAKKTLLGSL